MFPIEPKAFGFVSFPWFLELHVGLLAPSVNVHRISKFCKTTIDIPCHISQTQISWKRTNFPFQAPVFQGHCSWPWLILTISSQKSKCSTQGFLAKIYLNVQILTSLEFWGNPDTSVGATSWRPLYMGSSSRLYWLQHVPHSCHRFTMLTTVCQFQGQCFKTIERKLVNVLTLKSNTR